MGVGTLTSVDGVGVQRGLVRGYGRVAATSEAIREEGCVDGLCWRSGGMMLYQFLSILTSGGGAWHCIVSSRTVKMPPGCSGCCCCL